MTDAEDLAKKSVEALQGDVPRSMEDVRLARDLARERLRAVRQANRLRESFFWVAVTLAALTVGTSIVMVVWALAGAGIQAAVAVAFISGLAVETVGVLAVLAGYPVPREHRLTHEKSIR